MTIYILIFLRLLKKIELVVQLWNKKNSSVEIPQSRKLTEKGLQYQIDMKVNSLKSKKTALTGTKTLRKTLLLQGKCS